MVQKYITLNAFKEEPTIIHAVQGESESRTLYIALADSAGNPVDLTGKAVRFYAEKPDKTVVFADCTIEDAMAGKVSVALSYQTVAVKGTVNCTIYVNTSENEALKFTNLKIVVESSNVEMYVESSSEFSTLVEALSQVQDIDSRVPKTTTIAGINLQDDILLSELIAAGLAAGTGGAANNALALGGVGAANYPQISSGNFTPYFYGADTAGSPTYTLQDGSYYKIGQLVIVRIMLRISAKGGMAGRLLIGGWPFAPRGGGDGPIVLNDTTGFNLSGYNVLGGMITPDGGYFTKSSATVATAMTADDISDNLSMWGVATGYYLADN